MAAFIWTRGDLITAERLRTNTLVDDLGWSGANRTVKGGPWYLHKGDWYREEAKWALDIGGNPSQEIWFYRLSYAGGTGKWVTDKDLSFGQTTPGLVLDGHYDKQVVNEGWYRCEYRFEYNMTACGGVVQGLRIIVHIENNAIRGDLLAIKDPNGANGIPGFDRGEPITAEMLNKGLVTTKHAL